jgi:hypothetical protein
MFLDSWKIASENGIANYPDFGASDLTSTRWVTGYDKYRRAMQNRVDQVDSFEMTDIRSLLKMKQWLFDHGTGSVTGGVLLFTVYKYGAQEAAIPAGTPQAGKSFFKFWGDLHDTSSQHALTIVGYDDSVRFDFNGDKKYTNNVDISSHDGRIMAIDGRVDMADWEIGAVIVANSWGDSWGDSGFAYAPYRSLFISPVNGGLLSQNRLYFITVKKEYQPTCALKASITNTQRNNIAVSIGISNDPQANAPTKIRSFDKQFTYAGGPYPLCGKDGDSSIEIGLDVSDLLDSIKGSIDAKFFLIVDSKTSGGRIDSLSLLEYFSTANVKETKSAQKNVLLATGSAWSPMRTLASVIWKSSGIKQITPEVVSKPIIELQRFNGNIRLRALGCISVGLFDISGRKIRMFKKSNAEDWVLQNPPWSGSYFIKASMKNGSVVRKKILFNE